MILPESLELRFTLLCNGTDEPAAEQVDLHDDESDYLIALDQREQDEDAHLQFQSRNAYHRNDHQIHESQLQSCTCDGVSCRPESIVHTPVSHAENSCNRVNGYDV